MKRIIEIRPAEWDIVLSKLNDIREDNRHTRNNLFAVGIGLAVLIIGVVALAPVIFDIGNFDQLWR